MTAPTLTAIVCTHNPRPEHIEPTLASLAAQEDVPPGTAFILVDNRSDVALEGRIDLSALTNFASARIVREDKLGLTQARIRSFHEAASDILVYIDDDNILDPHYLANVAAAFAGDDTLGAIGGKSIPHYEVTPPAWFNELGVSLACRDLGEVPLFADWSSGEKVYPACAPIGAGMAIRRVAYAAWVEAVSDDTTRSGLGRRGTDLASGEDNDMVLTLLGTGWRVAYLPALSLTHLIPSGRLTPAYLERYVESSNRTWLQVLDVHGIRPRPPIPAWSLPLRCAKAYVAARAWRSPLARIRWKASCGIFAGQAKLGALR